MDSLGAIYFISGRGDVLIQRTYRDDIDKNIPAAFRTNVINSKSLDSASTAPVRQFIGSSFIHLRAGSVYLLAITRTNSNAMMILQFLSKVVDLIKSYCHGDFNEEVIKANFVLIYELLDEILDFGYPQISEPAVLKSLIFQKGFVLESTKKKREAAAQNATLQVTGAVGWRQDSIKYKKNEVFLDAIETVNMLMSAQGSVLRCDVQGRVVMKCFLSGMPDVKLGLNDKLEDVTFHPCVNLGRFQAEQVVSFVPPDGEFELMKYRCTGEEPWPWPGQGINLPFKAVVLVTEKGRTRLEVSVKLKSSFPSNLFATNVIVLIPMPEQTARANFQLSTGKAKYDPKRGSLVWKIKRFAGDAEQSLSASVEQIATTREKKAWSRPPMGMSFQIPMHSASGVRVQYLKVWEKSSYKVDKWVRKLCKSGDYHTRF
ncbi:AP-2 complex subunit mu [Auxenochlorella protothecoides]|uniref:AP-2 complex subunit mu n=1 Tax=Auxenochlorella protothecoides TaxID=3075 RepID=A0A087SJY1_AUXPR|nr:AP-2 complex subunit mu [Auxenochlorella protothecoides]KFM26035.1 AP-2 complex subunit mu [Auxenochlorella protothecoides]